MLYPFPFSEKRAFIDTKLTMKFLHLEKKVYDRKFDELDILWSMKITGEHSF